MVTPEEAKIMTPDNRTRPVPPDVVFSAAGAPPELAAQMQVSRPQPHRPEAAAAAAAAPIPRPPLPGTLPAGGAAAGTTTAATATTASTRGAAGSTAATAPAGVVPASVAALSINPQPAVPQVPANTATAPLALQPAAAAAASSSTQPTATGRHLMGRLATHVAGIIKESVPRFVQENQAVPQSSTASAAAVQEGQYSPYSQYSEYKQYSSEDDVLDVAEHLSSTQLYLAMFRGKGRGSSKDTTSTAAFEVGSQMQQNHYGLPHTPVHGYSSSSSSSSSRRGPGRQLLVLQDELDAFRRGPMRDQCARESASDWRPYKLFNLTDDVTNNPRYSQLLQGGDVVTVISAATAKLNQVRAAAPVQQQQQQPSAGSQTPAAAAATAVPVPPQPAAAAEATTSAAQLG